ncbi:MAG: hypothetical protein KC478_10870 [Bacteriovoracaceae bacterium]|nr:hypothetical protein [Bacteriovoracaceae bacterium]
MKKDKEEELISFFENLTNSKRYSLARIEVVPGKRWFVDHEFKDWEIEWILTNPTPEKDERVLSFTEVYSMRWKERAREDKYGNWWLMHGESIRTPIIKWARERGIRINILSHELVDFKTNNLAS